MKLAEKMPELVDQNIAGWADEWPEQAELFSQRNKGEPVRAEFSLKYRLICPAIGLPSLDSHESIEEVAIICRYIYRFHQVKGS